MTSILEPLPATHWLRLALFNQTPIFPSMKYLLLLFLCGCATKPCHVIVSEGAVHQLRHYTVTNQVSATESNLVTHHVLGVYEKGKAVELITVEGAVKK